MASERAVSSSKRLASYLTPNGPPNPKGLADAAVALGIAWPEDYTAFMSIMDGGEGWVGPAYLAMRSSGDLVGMSIQEFEPDLVIFATDGAGEGFGYDRSAHPPRIVMIPLIGLDEPIAQGESLDEFVDRLLADALFMRPDSSEDIRER